MLPRISRDGYMPPVATLKLSPRIARLFASPIARPDVSMTTGQKIWSVVVQFGRLVKAMDIELKDMPMNGGMAGCHFPEASRIGESKAGCNTHYKAGTFTNAFIEVRPVAGTNISRVYRFVVAAKTPLLHKYKGFLPVVNDGFYGELGPIGNAKGEMRRRNTLGPFGGEGSDGADDYFNIPLRGAIPQNWASTYGNLVYALRYPFNMRLKFTEGFLGVWGIVDPALFRKVNVPFGTFPTELGDLLWLLSNINSGKPTHVNLNKPYEKTGKKPHIEWLGFKTGTATILMKDGTIDVPGFVKIKFNGAAYREKHPGFSGDLNRIDIKSTSAGVEFTIDRPAIETLEFGAGRFAFDAQGLSVGRLKLVLPSVDDLTAGKRKISDARIFMDGFSAEKLSLREKNDAFRFSAESLKVGKLALSPDGGIHMGSINAHRWNVDRTEKQLSIGGEGASIGSISIGRRGDVSEVALGAFSNRALTIRSPLVDIKTRNISSAGMRTTIAKNRMDIAIDNASMDIHDGRIGATNFGSISIGAGRVGKCSLRDGQIRVSINEGIPRANISGIADLVVNKTLGSRLDFNVPGLAISGELANINIKGPAHFVLTPTSWSVQRLNHISAMKLALTAQVKMARILHDPSVRDETIRNVPSRDVIVTDIALSSATLGIADVSRLEFLTKRHPDANGSRFSHFEASDVSITDIAGKGVAWAKLPIWQYVSAGFAKLEGSIKIASIDIEANGGGRRSSFKDVVFDLYDTDGQRHRCAAKIPLLKFTPQDYFIGDPNGKPIQLNCRLNAQLRGGYFQFTGKQRPLKDRRPYK